MNRFQKEIAEMMEEMKNGVVRGNIVGLQGGPSKPPPEHPQLPQSVHVSPVDPSQWLGLNHSTVHATYPNILLNPQYRLQSFFAPDDPMAAGMQGNPKSLNDLTAGQAEERFYQYAWQALVRCERRGKICQGVCVYC